jgi:hypothetical protein
VKAYVPGHEPEIRQLIRRGAGRFVCVRRAAVLVPTEVGYRLDAAQATHIVSSGKWKHSEAVGETRCWVVTPQWVRDSFSQQRQLVESDYRVL